MQRDLKWLEERLQQAQSICNRSAINATKEALWLGIDLGTCDVVSIVIDKERKPVAVCLDWADVVRDGIVWDYFGAVNIVNKHLDILEEQLGFRFEIAATSFPPGTDPRISVNVLEAAGLKVSKVIDEPSAIAEMLQLDNVAVVDIGGGTTGIAIVKEGIVTRSVDEPTGGHHISLTLAGNQRIELEEAEDLKKQKGQKIWPIVRPVYEKMADIVAANIKQENISAIWMAGGSCMQPGVKELFQDNFKNISIFLPQPSIFITPLAIADCGISVNGGEHE